MPVEEYMGSVMFIVPHRNSMYGQFGKIMILSLNHSYICNDAIIHALLFATPHTTIGSV